MDDPIERDIEGNDDFLTYELKMQEMEADADLGRDIEEPDMQDGLQAQKG